MPDAPAIAAATAILQELLKEGMSRHDPLLAQVDVTSQPPDKVNANVDRATLNVFLYRVAMPPTLRTVAAGRTASAPPGLTLHYLLIAHGRVDHDAGDLSHRVLGAALRALHDSPVITTGDVEPMLPSKIGLTRPHTLTIRPIEMNLGDMATLWTMFRTTYRLSITCEVQLAAADGAQGSIGAPETTTSSSPDEFARALRDFGLDTESSEAMQQLKASLEAPPRATGLRALFSGKDPRLIARAAQLLATASHRELQRLDLAAIADQYIGETEKNLRRLFEAAEAAGAILLFDEADALFGKRTEVRSAHDRYANLEVSYLMRQIDAYSGLVILATARKASLDPSVLRRFRIDVEFARQSPV